MAYIEEIKWKNVPKDRPDSLEGELNLLDYRSRTMNSPDHIMLIDDFNSYSLRQKLTIMDRYIQQALETTEIDDIPYLQQHLMSIYTELAKINKPEHILLDNDTSLLDKLSTMDSLLNDSFRGKSIESINYEATPQGHKSSLKDELAYVYEFINSIKKDAVIKDTQALNDLLSSLENKVNILMERTNVLPIISRFELVNDTYEMGQSISVIEVRWEANKVFKSGQILIDGNSVADVNDYLQMDFVPSAGSLLVPSLSIRETKEITIELVDEYSTPATNVTKIRFLNRVLYGAIPFNSTIDQELLDRILKSPLLENPYSINFKIQCGDYGDLVPVIAFPHDWGIESYQIQLYNAGNYNLWNHQVKPYINHTGYRSLYDVYILNQPLSGNVIIKILDFI